MQKNFKEHTLDAGCIFWLSCKVYSMETMERENVNTVRWLTNTNIDRWSRSTSIAINHVDCTYNWNDVMKMALYLHGLPPMIYKPSHVMRKNQKNSNIGPSYKIFGSSKLSRSWENEKVRKTATTKSSLKKHEN